MEVKDRQSFDELIVAFKEYLRRTRGIPPGSSRKDVYYVRSFIKYVDQFLVADVLNERAKGCVLRSLVH